MLENEENITNSNEDIINPPLPPGVKVIKKDKTPPPLPPGVTAIKKKDVLESTSTTIPQKLDSEPKNGSLDGQQPKMKTFTGLSQEDLKNLKSPETPLPKINQQVKKSLETNKANLQRKSELEKELKTVKVTPENQEEVSAKTDELLKLQKQQEAQISKSKEREIEKQKYNKVSSLTNHFLTGTSQIGADIASIPELAYDVFASPQNLIADTFDLPFLHADSENFKKTTGINNAVKDYYKQEVSNLKQKAQETDLKYQDGVYDSFVNGDYAGGFDQLTNSFAESLPATSSIMVGGAAMKAPQLIAASSMMFGAGKNEQLKDENPDMNTNARVVNSLATGLIQGATESLGSGSIGAAAKGLVEREGPKKAMSILKDGLTEYYKAALTKNPLLASMSGEGLEEAFQGVAENAVDVATGVKPQDYNIYSTMADDFIGGAFGGAVFGAGIKGIQQVTNYQDKNQIKANTKKVFTLQNELQNPELSEESKVQINKNIDEIVKNNQKLVQKNIEHVESLSPKVKESLLKSIQVTESTQDKAKQIKLDSSTSDQTKQILLDSLKKEFNKANELKNNILEGKTTEVDVLPLKEQDKLKREALKELTQELNPEGKKSITITNEQITERANKNYSNQIKDEIKSETVAETEPQAEVQKPTDETQELKEVVVPETKETTSNVKVKEILNRPATLTSFGGLELKTPVDGDVYQEGQRIVFEDKNNKIYDLGSVDEISESKLSELGLKENDNLVVITKEGKVKTDDGEWNIQNDLPTKGIEYNNDGNITAVSLKDDTGKTIMYDGQKAEDIGYQILLSEAESDLQRDKVNQILENDENINRQFREAEKVAEKRTGKVAEPSTEKSKSKEINATIQETTTKSNGDISTGTERVEKVRDTKPESVVSEKVSTTVEPRASEAKVEVSVSETKKPSKVGEGEVNVPSKKEPTKPKEEKPKVTNEFESKPRKKSLLNRLVEGGNSKEITDTLTELGKDYDVRNQKEADSYSKEFIKKVGIAEALKSAKDGLIKNNDVKFLVYSEGLNQLQNEIDKTSNLNDREDLIKEFQALSNSFDEEVRNSGQGISILNYIYNKNQSLKYSLSKLINDYKANDINGEISPEVKAEFEKLTNQLKDVEERIKEAEKRALKAEEELAIKNIQEDISRKKTAKKSNSEEAKELANKIRKAKIHKPGIFSSATPASLVWDGSIEIVAKTIEKGGSIADAVQKGLEYIKKSDWYKNLSKDEKQEAEETFISNINESKLSKDTTKVTIDEEGKIKIPSQVIRDYVESGETDIDAISKKIKKDISEEYPDVELRDIRDAITGYGKEINPTKDEITSKINRLKEYGRLLSAYEDIKEGKEPKKRTNKKVNTEQKSKELRREINRLARELGFNEEQRLNTAKTRVKNLIEELETKIKNKDFAKKESKPLIADTELNDLRAEKAKIFNEFEKQKYLQELKNRSFKRKLLDEGMEALGLARAIKASLDLGLIGIQLRGLTYSELWRNPKELGKKFIKMFGAIGSQSKTNKAMEKLMGQPLYSLAEKLDIGMTHPDLRNEVREELASGNLLHFVWNSPMLLANNAGMKELTETKRDALGDKFVNAFNKQFNKLDELTKKEKEKYSIAEQWSNVNPFEAVERGLSTYGNQLRFEEFVRGVERLKAEGKDEINHPEDYKALASYIRTFTGRAKPAGFEMNQKALNVFFFSFKNAVSVFQQLNPLYYAYLQKESSDFKNGNYTKLSVANKMAMATFLKSVTSTAVTIMFLTAMYNAFKDDDDEELTFETDPTSSDFGKLKKGDLRYDPWGGYIPLITLYARLIREEVKKADGSTYKFGEQRFGIENRFDATGRFLVNKESPGFQIFHKYLNSTEQYNEQTGEMERVDKFGKKLSEDEALSLYPIFLGSVRDAIKEDADGAQAFLTAYSILGLGNVQKYPSSDK